MFESESDPKLRGDLELKGTSFLLLLFNFILSSRLLSF